MKMGFFILLAILVLLTGCTGNSAGIASGTAIADEKAGYILEGLSKGDYAMFSNILSDNARQALDEDYFNRLRGFVKENSGDYVAKALAASKDEDNLHILSYDCQFSMESVFFTITFNADYSEVEGIYLDSENMRNALGQQLDFAKQD